MMRHRLPSPTYAGNNAAFEIICGFVIGLATSSMCRNPVMAGHCKADAPLAWRRVGARGQ